MPVAKISLSNHELENTSEEPAGDPGMYVLPTVSTLDKSHNLVNTSKRE